MAGGKVSQLDSKKRGLIELVIILVVALMVALIVRTFLLALFYIPSESMVPTLKVKDRIFVNKLSYRFNNIERGDIVVLDAPPSVKTKEVKVLIKRVIWPWRGEEKEACIACCKEGGIKIFLSACCYNINSCPSLSRLVFRYFLLCTLGFISRETVSTTSSP